MIKKILQLVIFFKVTTSVAQIDHYETIVFEDDAQPTLKMHSYLNNPERAPPSFDLFLLGWSGRPPLPLPPSPIVDDDDDRVTRNRNNNNPTTAAPFYYYQRITTSFWGLHAYVLSQRGATRMLQMVKQQGGITAQLDSMLSSYAAANEMEIYGVNGRLARKVMWPLERCRRAEERHPP